MAGRETEAVQRAVKRYEKGETVLAAARAEGVAPRSLHQALTRHGVAKRGPVAGPLHHAWVDGRTAERERRRQSR